MEEWKLIFEMEVNISGVLEGFLFGLLLLNVFVNDL